MGAASTLALARRGHDVLTLEARAPGHREGSSHGSTRIVRRSYLDPDYLEMTGRAFALWRALEQLAGTRLLTMTGALECGAGREPRRLHEVLSAAGVPCELVEPGCRPRALAAGAPRRRRPVPARRRRGRPRARRHRDAAPRAGGRRPGGARDAGAVDRRRRRRRPRPYRRRPDRGRRRGRRRRPLALSVAGRRRRPAAADGDAAAGLPLRAGRTGARRRAGALARRRLRGRCDQRLRAPRRARRPRRRQREDRRAQPRLGDDGGRARRAHRRGRAPAGRRPRAPLMARPRSGPRRRVHLPLHVDAGRGLHPRPRWPDRRVLPLLGARGQVHAA